MATAPTPITALPDVPLRSSPSNFAARADNFLGALPVYGTQLNSIAQNVYANAAEAFTKASEAAASAALAGNKASEASSSAAAAAASATGLAAAVASASASAVSADADAAQVAQDALEIADAVASAQNLEANKLNKASPAFTGNMSGTGTASVSFSSTEGRSIKLLLPASYNNPGYDNLIYRINFPWYAESWDIGIRRGNSTDLQSMEWWFNGTTKLMELTRAGNLGIGTANPEVRLDVAGITRTSQYFSVNNVGYLRGDEAGLLIVQGGTTATHIRNNANNTNLLTVLNGGNVGIGTTNPSAKLHVALEGTANLASAAITATTAFAPAARAGFGGLVNNADGVYFGMGADGAGIPAGLGFFREATGWNTALAFYANNITGGPDSTAAMQEKMRITSAGNVGIGVRAPTGTLDVARGLAGSGTAVFRGTDHLSHFSFGSNEDTYIRGGKDSSRVLINDSPAGNVILATGGGNVGIGTATPLAFLSVGNGSLADSLVPVQMSAGGSQRFYGVNRTDGQYGALVGWSAAHGVVLRSVNSADQLSLVVNNSIQALTVLPSGYVGIGTTNPAAQLHVSNGAQGLEFHPTGGIGGYSAYIQAYDRSASYMDLTTYARNHYFYASVFTGAALTIGANGNVSIGTTSPSQKLEIALNHTAANQGTPASSGTTQNGALRLSSGPGGIGYGEVLDFGVNVGNIAAWIQSTNRGNLGINYALSLNPNGGNVGIGVAVPQNSLHVKGIIKAGGNPSSQQYGIVALGDDATDGYYNGIFRTTPAGNALTGGNWAAIGGYDGVHITTGQALFGSQTPRLTVVNATGYVGIGLINPESKLHVRGVISVGADGGTPGSYTGLNLTGAYSSPGLASTGVFFGGDGVSHGVFAWVPNTNSFILSTGNNSTAIGDSYGGANLLLNGNVGVGVTSPASKLHVMGTKAYGSHADALILGHTIATGDGTQSTSYGGVRFIGNGYDWAAIRSVQFSPSASWHNGLIFSTMNGGGGSLAERVIINNNGDMGIGTLYPSAGHRLTVQALDARFDVKSSTAGNVAIRLISNNNIAASLDAMDSTFTVAKSLTINPNGGNVGIGVFNPQFKLDVAGDARFYDVRSRRAANTGVLYFGDSVDAYLYFDGTTYSFGSAGNGLYVPGNLAVNGRVTAALGELIRDGGNYGAIYSDSNNIAFFTDGGYIFANRTNSGSRMHLSSAGNLSVYGAGTSSFSGHLKVAGGSKLVIQSTVNGGYNNGIFLWSETDANWGIYMATSGANTAMSGGVAPASIDGRTSHHVRFRANNNVENGFIWENNIAEALMSLNGNNGILYVRGDIYAGNSTTNKVLHTGNFSDYTVPLAQTARAGFLGGQNMNTYTVPGLYEYDPNVTGAPSGSHNHKVLSIGSANRWSQLAFPYESDQAFFRRYNDGSFGAWRELVHSGNVGSYTSIRNASGFLAPATWIQFDGAYGLHSPSNNGANFYPNQGTYGSWAIEGTRNGWAGLEFPGGVQLMMNTGTVGIHRTGAGWLFRWDGGTLFCNKNHSGISGLDAVVLDAVNVNNYAVGLSGIQGIGGTKRFVSTANVSTDGGPGSLEVYSDGGAGAVMSFHRGGHYALNMGLDSDNVFRIGGWSSGSAPYRFQTDGAGNTQIGGHLNVGTDIYLNNYGRSLVGVYAATRYQGIFAMGPAYMLAADGTSTNGFYGIAWTHENIGGQSKAGLSHQALFINNGATHTAIGTGIWTVGAVTAASFNGSGSGLSGTASSLTAGNSNGLNGLSKGQIFNNTGVVHGNYQSFGSFPDFGHWFMQNFNHTDGPTGPGGGVGQYYVTTSGLGAEYGYGSYAIMTAIKRTETNPVLWVRYQENGNWSAWFAIGGGGSAVVDATGTTTTAVAGSHYTLTNGSASTLTLPASPAVGATVTVSPCNGLATNVIGRNGQYIHGLAEDMVMDNPQGTYTLKYLNATVGWRLI